MQTRSWYLYGSELSPFTLKLQALCDFVGLSYALVPTQGRLLENLAIHWRVKRLQRGHLQLTWPEMTEEDEFPLVPYLFGPEGDNLYDSTAIAYWLDKHLGDEQSALLPKLPVAAFVATLIDDYADEFGLYLVHHHRWTVSATDNNAGQRLANEYRSLLGPLQPLFGKWFSHRQVKRLPYLFSTAPEGHSIPGLPNGLQPPHRKGFPATHQRLEDAFKRLLNALETLLQRRPYILGDRFCLADAAIYGQLAMNLDDPSAARIIQHVAPTVHAWLRRIRQGEFERATSTTAWLIDADLAPLLGEISRTHMPLMQQNMSAFLAWKRAGERRFNEAAFNQNRALYDGSLDGLPFRHVAKSFQAKTWRQCCERWQALESEKQKVLAELIPQSGLFMCPAANIQLVK